MSWQSNILTKDKPTNNRTQSLYPCQLKGLVNLSTQKTHKLKTSFLPAKLTNLRQAQKNAARYLRRRGRHKPQIQIQLNKVYV